ncbi:acyl-CoA thioesterase [Oceanicaulis sp. LC35]|uniref:acyl-CoA thioesterase n=1 Tax=Oceanicaulis sp. LC35 TaxID=3349635 RepID=UPI003F870320
MIAPFRAVAHPWLCDVMGHLTTRHYMAMFDDASYHALNAVFGWSGTDAEATGIGFVDVRHEIDYVAEVRAGDLLEIRPRLGRLGGKSVTLVYDMIILGREERAARLTAVSVCFDTKARKASALPDEWRARAVKFESLGAETD